MVKHIVVFSMLLFSNFVFAHEHQHMNRLLFSNGEIHAHATWIKGPQTPEDSILRLEWKSGVDHTPIEPPGGFEVEISMPSMDHGPGFTQTMQVLDENGQVMTGVYEVSTEFFMAGEWVVSVTLKYPDGTTETQTIKLTIAGDHQH